MVQRMNDHMTSHTIATDAPAASPSADAFAFTQSNLAQARDIMRRYPQGRETSAVMPLLTLAQTQNDGWLSQSAIAYVATLLNMPVIRVQEVASFYTMYNLQPVGKHVVEVCTTTPCWLRGCGAVVQACEDQLGIKLGETTADGHFTLREVECLGACVNAPMMQINGHYYEDLDADSTRRILSELAQGRTPGAGSQTGRRSSEPSAKLSQEKQ